MNMEYECRLEEIIKAGGWKKGYIADRAGIHRSTLTLILKGQMPYLHVALMISDVVGIPVQDIWVKKEPPT
ncbi:helix-turn-helix transcriptional regulator [Fictibacillus sp. 7GRE50]|uniref:helix-turn-helix transcriptional regulator n=1 Tax=Fictibacillus sp. 7GRE50 TaxID=2745878 RepID=UPI0018CDD4BF|nr:helix-turn-helix transcriptional regulator [Fictibacillus sp. 7GRE50]MBH0166293.1 helix-turn-helix transcriptional regulator [Fictibacillus sp. 7GRE50]